MPPPPPPPSILNAFYNIYMFLFINMSINIYAYLCILSFIAPFPCICPRSVIKVIKVLRFLVKKGCQGYQGYQVFAFFCWTRNEKYFKGESSRYKNKGLGYDDKQMQGYEAISDNMRRYA